MKYIPRWARWCLGLFLFFFIVALIPPRDRALYNMRRKRCQENLKQISLACQQYRQDYDAHFPPISVGGDQGWADLLAPYTKSFAIFQCPVGQKPFDQRRSDYFYNARLAKTSGGDRPQETIVFGDGVDNSGTNSHLLELPFDYAYNAAREDAPTSPARRHLDGANYAFADGHLKWLLPTKIVPDTTFRRSSDSPDYTLIPSYHPSSKSHLKR